MKLLILTVLLMAINRSVFSLNYLEKGEIGISFEKFLAGKPTKEDLYLIKSIAHLIDVKVPPYMEKFARGILYEKEGNIQGAIENYLESIKLNPGYNPSYFRFNELIRKIKNPETFREKIEDIIIKRFKKAPPVIISNPPGKIIFIVEKMSQYLLIYRGKELIGIHPVTTGMDWEDKWKEGDRRTPEGIYFFTEFIPPSRLPKMYGGIAVVMNYPNPVDRILKKGGGGIWLHGSDSGDRNKIPFSTRGCVVAENTSLKEIVKKIKTHNTLIAVYKTVPDGNPSSRIHEFIEEWKHSWESRDFKKYISFYSKKFRWKRGSFKEWERYKKRVILGKKRIKISIRDLTILGFWKKGEKPIEYYVAEFTQIYESDTYSDRGLKRLYIMREGDKLKIISEEFLREGRK
jgi:murein L,D-transpeptidase YafK